MTKEEMLTILVESSGGSRSKADIRAMLAPDPVEENLCVCGEPLNDGSDHYDHMSNGY